MAHIGDVGRIVLFWATSHYDRNDETSHNANENVITFEPLFLAQNQTIPLNMGLTHEEIKKNKKQW